MDVSCSRHWGLGGRNSPPAMHGAMPRPRVHSDWGPSHAFPPPSPPRDVSEGKGSDPMIESIHKSREGIRRPFPYRFFSSFVESFVPSSLLDMKISGRFSKASIAFVLLLYDPLYQQQRKFCWILCPPRMHSGLSVCRNRVHYFSLSSCGRASHGLP